MTEICKVKSDLAPGIMKGVFHITEKSYFLWNKTHFGSNEIREAKYDIEIPSFLCPKLWISLLDDCKTLTSLEEYGTKIKTCLPENWLYKTDISFI